jgi:hypothetical protein
MSDEDTGAPKKGAKKTAAKKPSAKKSTGKKPPAKKPRAKKPAEAEATVSAEAAEVVREEREEAAREAAEERVGRLAEEVLDAEIIAETPADEEEAETAAAKAADEAVEAESELSEEERELAAVYGEEMSAPATAHAEYQDRQTRDEDRPMMPEINARDERRHQWQERRDRRKQRREERQQRREAQGGGGGGGGQPQPQGGRPPEQRPHDQRGHEQRQHEPRAHEHRPLPQAQPPVNGHAPDGMARVGTPLGDAAATVFAQLRNGQPLPVRQLAAMMRKRSLVQQDPEQLWPQLKAELLGDERSYRSLGLRPRIVYRGRDLFAPGPVAISATADAEAEFAGALSRLAGATHRALSARLVKASPAGFERIIHAYLVAAGYRDIDWIKRVGGISYASALAPGLDRTVLLSARSGDQPIDRRAIGELRVGVEAKDLVSGILFSPREISEDAERELERAGRSIAVFCGDQLVAALVQAGVGVVSAAAPLHYVDDQLLDELLAG